MADSSDLLVEKKLSSKNIYDGVLLHVVKDSVLLPNGNTSVREWIDHPGASAVVPLFENGDVMLVKQYRYPLDKVFYEVPAGKIDSGEQSIAAAKRELKEETGVIVQQIKSLGEFYPTIGYSNEIIHLYIACDIEITATAMDEDEFVISERVPFNKAVEMAYDGKITDGKTIAALVRAKHWLKNR